MATPQEAQTKAPPKQIELEQATLRIREDGVVDIIVKRNTDVTVESARAMNAAVRELSDEPIPILADMRSMRGAGILTMRYAAGPEGAMVASRLALLVGSPVSRMLGSVFLGLSKPPYPTRLFTDENAAVAWLLEGSGEAA